MQPSRLNRSQQVERNREQLLAAARQVFLERGFHGASLDAIAEAAGFSKGVVYSQFASKADLFLALLEKRIDERAAENERVVARHAGSTGGAGVDELLATGERSVVSEPAWSLLLIEFRVHAARDPVLNERYARLHARTVERLAAALGAITGEDGTAVATKALFVLALGAGLALEDAVSLGGLPSQALRAMAVRAVDLRSTAAVAATGRAAPRRSVRRARRTS